MQVDDGNSFQFIKLSKVGHILPSFRDHAFDDIHGHGRDVFISHDALSISQEQVFDGTVRVGNNFLDGFAGRDFSALSFNAFYHGRTHTLRLVAIQKGHLQTIVFIQKSVHGGQNDSHTQLIRINKVQSLGHGNKDFFIDAVGHAVHFHKVLNREFILSINKVLSFNQHGQQRRSCLQLFSQGQHFLVHQDGQPKVKGCGNTRNEIKGGEFTGQFLHGKNHFVDLPLQTIMNIQFIKEIHHVGIGTKKNVQARFNPISILILPSRYLSTQSIASFVHHGFVTGIGQILGTRQTR
mmetsp:Transcript_2821/g.3791  ORF Transcript_2821/g.3791 Transcript_2821/m.3791 type:complete len:294 (-) Transcript_2821:53-934(-)